jgi:hypothetical protein
MMIWATKQYLKYPEANLVSNLPLVPSAWKKKNHLRL